MSPVCSQKYHCSNYVQQNKFTRLLLDNDQLWGLVGFSIVATINEPKGDEMRHENTACCMDSGDLSENTAHSPQLYSYDNYSI